MDKLKYYTEFLDVNQKRYRVEILDETYTGMPEVMELGPDAVQLSRPSRKITEPVFSMGVNIQVWCNENFEYFDLFSTREHTNQVVIKREGNIIFKGWVEPNLYEEDFTAPPYLISIPASDGLAGLENYYPNGFTGTGKRSLLQSIQNCLACTGMDLPINIACSLNTDDKKDNRLFETTFVEVECFRDYKDGVYEYDNAKDLLEDILKPFSCRIYQSGGEWYVERIKDRTTPNVAWVRYEGNAAGQVVNRNPAISLDTPAFMFIDSAASLQIDAGYGRQTVKADGDTWDTAIMNNFTDGIRHLPIVAYPSYPFEVERRAWYKRGSNVTVTPFSNHEIEQGIRIQHTINSNSDDRIWQTAPISATNEDEIEVSFKLMLELGTAQARDGRYKVKIQSYLRDKQGTSVSNMSLKWDKDKSDETYYINGIGSDYVPSCYYSLDKEMKGVQRVPIDISFTAKLAHLNDVFYFDAISFAVFPVEAQNGKSSSTASSQYVRSTIIGDISVKVNEKRKYDNTYTATVNKDYMREAEDIDIRFWTLPGKYASRSAQNYNFKNGLMNSDGTAIAKISCPPENTGKMSIAEQLLLDNFDQYYDPRDKLSGDVTAETYIAPEQYISVATRPGKSYLLVGLEASLRDAIYQVEVEEIKSHQISING